MKRKLGLDVGDKTIGIALSDPLNITAQGLETYGRIGIKKDTSYIMNLVKENDCDAVIIGLPLNLKGEDSIQTKKTREFKERLVNKLMSSGLSNVKIFWQDERFTTVIAEDILIAGGVRREDRKRFVDKQAAVLILQSWLDSRE